MFSEGSLLGDLMSQTVNCLVASVIVAVTATVIVASTYFIAGNCTSHPPRASDTDAALPGPPEDSPAISAAAWKQPAPGCKTQTGAEDRRPEDDQDTDSEDEAREQPEPGPVFLYHTKSQNEKMTKKKDKKEDQHQHHTGRQPCRENLSPHQMAEERQGQQDQLVQIFRMMQDHEGKFGITSVDEIRDQMKLYVDL